MTFSFLSRSLIISRIWNRYYYFFRLVHFEPIRTCPRMRMAEPTWNLSPACSSQPTKSINRSRLDFLISSGSVRLELLITIDRCSRFRRIDPFKVMRRQIPESEAVPIRLSNLAADRTFPARFAGFHVWSAPKKPKKNPRQLRWQRT